MYTILVFLYNYPFAHISDDIFCEYMDILNERLAPLPGIKFCGANWNALFYADDVILIAINLAHAQLLINVCDGFAMHSDPTGRKSGTKVQK